MKGFGLSPGITRQQRIDIEKAAQKAFGNLDESLKGNYYPLLGMDEKDRLQMIEDHFLFVSGDKNLQVGFFPFICFWNFVF